VPARSKRKQSRRTAGRGVDYSITSLYFTNLLILPFQGVVVQKLFNQVDVRHEHAPAAVPLEVQGVQGVSFGVVSLQEVEIRVPLVADDL
jgi:hypothetical protein